MSGKNRQLSISFNSPVVLIFSLICLISLGLGVLTGGRTTTLFFSVYRSSLSDPLTYVRFIGHVFGHAGWDHLISNLMLLLIVGPMLEEKYGSVNLLFVILITAIVTGVVNFVFFPNIRLLGASGVVFAFILLSSFASMRAGSIPMTFLLVAIIYIGGQLYDGIFVQDNVSNLTHILAGQSVHCSVIWQEEEGWDGNSMAKFTKKAILLGFLEILKSKPLDKITVKGYL